MKTRIASYLIISGFVLSLTGCNTMEPTSGSAMSKPTAMADKSLYDRLGGKPAITAVVDDFVGRVAADNRINANSPTPTFPNSKCCWWNSSARPPAVLAPTPVAA